jgi:CTD small phosphatase-like protein 2
MLAGNPRKKILPQLDCTDSEIPSKISPITPMTSKPNVNSPKYGKKFSFTPKSQPNKIKQMVTQVNLECEGEQAYKQHLAQTFNAMRYIKTIKPVDLNQLESKTVSLSKKKNYKKTVVFDLDETLVHCCSSPELGSVIIDIRLPNGEIMKAGINIRPYVQECLKALNEYYEVIVFTASHKCYADTVLDYLDPSRELIQHRLYREHCILTDNLHIKDLRILDGRRIEDIIIVDNAAYSFAYQIDNGIPIISWYSDSNDKELYNLIEYLSGIHTLEDLRQANRQTFHLHTFYRDYLRDFVTENKENSL